MADKLADFINSRQGALEDNRVLHESVNEEVARYCRPEREGQFTTNGAKAGQQQGKYIYDGTAAWALNIAANGFFGSMVSASYPWLRTHLGIPELDDMAEISRWFQDVDEALLDSCARSNFYEVMPMSIKDGLSCCPGIVYMEEDAGEGRIDFEAAHPGECWIARGKNRKVDVLHRKRKYTARVLAKKFGRESLPISIRNVLDNAPFSEFEILHAVYPREERDITKIDSKNKPFASVWLHMQDVLSEGGYGQFPYALWSYEDDSLSPYGRSPGGQSLPTNKALQLLSKTMQGAAEMSVNGPLNVPAELKDKVQWRPRGVNPYTDPDKIVRPAMTGINYPIGVDREERLQETLEKFFHVNFFLMLNRAQKREITAAEVYALQGELATTLGPVVGRLSGFFDRLLDRVFEIEWEAGRIPPPPDVLLQYAADRPIKIEYMGPLAQMQKKLFETQGVQQWFNAIAPVLQTWQETLDIVDADKLVRRSAKSFNIPYDVLRSDRDVAILRQGRLEAQKQQSMLENMAGGAQAAKTLAEAGKAANEGGVIASAG